MSVEEPKKMRLARRTGTSLAAACRGGCQKGSHRSLVLLVRALPLLGADSQQYSRTEEGLSRLPRTTAQRGEPAGPFYVLGGTPPMHLTWFGPRAPPAWGLFAAATPRHLSHSRLSVSEAQHMHSFRVAQTLGPHGPDPTLSLSRRKISLCTLKHSALTRGSDDCWGKATSFWLTTFSSLPQAYEKKSQRLTLDSALPR